jgi:methionyl-tRNA formyltransferase
MEIALFAAHNVGKEIAEIFARFNDVPAFLVLDSLDKEGVNSNIIRTSGVLSERIFYSESLDKECTLSRLRAVGCDLAILAWWPYILKRKIIEIPRMGILNTHPSLLPYNPGKHYNFWTIVEDTPFGVTLHWVDEDVDAGDIAFQERIEKTWEDTGETLYYKAQKEIVKLFQRKYVEIRRGNIPRIRQQHEQGIFHRSEEIDNASRIEIDNNYKARDLLNILRARTFPPHPGAWFVENGERYEIRIKVTKK